MDASPLGIAVTGHRPADLFGYDRTHPDWGWLRMQLRQIVEDLAASELPVLLSGMAQGVDQEFADLGVTQGWPVEAFVPFDGQQSRWPAEAQTRYRRLLRRCSRVRFVSCTPSMQAFLVRNEAMVQACDVLIAVWTGKRWGGTFRCLEAGLAAGRHVVWLDPVARRILDVGLR